MKQIEVRTTIVVAQLLRENGDTRSVTMNDLAEIDLDAEITEEFFCDKNLIENILKEYVSEALALSSLRKGKDLERFLKCELFWYYPERTVFNGRTYVLAEGFNLEVFEIAFRFLKETGHPCL